MRVAFLALAAVACRTPPAKLPAAAKIADWIPNDVAMVIVGTPDPELDAVARAMDLQPPGELLGPHGLAWMLFADHTTVQCRLVDAPDGAATEGSTMTITKGGIACAVTNAVGSIREHDAARIATLTASERLSAHVTIDVRWPIWAWGHGAVIGAGIDQVASQALAGRDLTLTVGLAHGHLEIGVPGAPDATIAMGDHVGTAPDLALTPVPADDNTDVPLSEAYQQARAAIDQLDPDAAWRAAWGTAKVKGEQLEWVLPAAPRELRVHATAAADAVVAARRAAIDDLVKLRAHDVAAYDRDHR